RDVRSAGPGPFRSPGLRSAPRAGGHPVTRTVRTLATKGPDDRDGDPLAGGERPRRICPAPLWRSAYRRRRAVPGERSPCGMTLATRLIALIATPAGDAAGEPLLLDFHASWCGPCQEMRPAIALLKKKGYRVKSVDPKESPELAERYEVTSIP